MSSNVEEISGGLLENLHMMELSVEVGMGRIGCALWKPFKQARLLGALDRYCRQD